MSGGRPSKYEPDFHPRVVEILARIGLTEDQIAEKLDLNRSTIQEWKKEHEEFSTAIKKGKADPDDLVEKALFERAIGYEWDEEETFKVKKGKDFEETVTIVTKKRMPPDVVADIYWLNNRRPGKWRNRKDEEGRNSDRPPLNINFNGTVEPELLDPEKNDNLEISTGKPSES